MDTESSSPLHLPSLKIAGFRGFDRFTIPCLGRVTLIAGRNSVGKTTVLDAVRLFAARGRPRVLSALLHEREELASSLDEDQGPLTVPDVAALFHGRGKVRTTAIAIGPGSEEEDLKLAASPPGEWTDEQMKLLADVPLELDVEALRVSYGEWSEFVPWLFMGGHPSYLPRMRRGRFDDTDWPAPVECVSLGPGLPDNEQLARQWNLVALTQEEEFLVQALRLILGAGVERISVVGDEARSSRFRSSRRVIVKLSGHPRPVPLKSFGDGATRLFGTALALTRSRKGLLVIDEAENGLHYTVHEDFWRMVLNAAREGDIQVLATTHSWDCIVGFARAATKYAHTDGALVRLEPDDGGCRAVVYSEEDLAVAADQRIEVR